MVSSAFRDHVLCVLSWVDSFRATIELVVLPKSFRLEILGRCGIPRPLWKPYDGRALASTRAHLHAVRQIWDAVQVPYRRRAAKSTVPLPAVVTPLVLHDQYTLYAGNLNVPALRERPCGTCGTERALSATPPIIVRGNLRRASLPVPVAFCWQCLRANDHAAAIKAPPVPPVTAAGAKESKYSLLPMPSPVLSML